MNSNAHNLRSNAIRGHKSGEELSANSSIVEQLFEESSKTPDKKVMEQLSDNCKVRQHANQQNRENQKTVSNSFTKCNKLFKNDSKPKTQLKTSSNQIRTQDKVSPQLTPQLTTRSGRLRSPSDERNHTPVAARRLSSPSNLCPLRRSTRIASTGNDWPSLPMSHIICRCLGSDSIKSEESSSVPTTGPQTIDTPESQSTNESENSQQNCLKLTIRVRRLNHISNATTNSINDNKNSLNNDNNNNIAFNGGEDSLLTDHSLDSKSTVLYEVMPSSSATTSSSASECGSTATATNSVLQLDPTLIRNSSRSKKKKKKKSKRRSRENTECMSPTRSPMRSPVRTPMESTGGSDSASSPLNGAKRLRLIVGNDTISIDIKKKLSLF